MAAEFDKLNRQVARFLETGKAPKQYIRIIAEVEDTMNEALAKQKVTPKKMNATQARALNAVKQKVKKTNKDYQTQIDAYKADKDEFMQSSEEEAPAPKSSTKTVRIETEAPVTAEDDDEGFATVGKSGRALTYTPESIFKNLRGIMDTRGKKNTDRTEQIKVMEKLKSTPIDDFYAKGTIRADGRFVHDMYLMQVKSPSESKGTWDYYKIVKKLPGDEVFTTKEETKCALWK